MRVLRDVLRLAWDTSDHCFLASLSTLSARLRGGHYTQPEKKFIDVLV